MSVQAIKFSNTRLAGTGKVGVIPKDADGYSTVVVGGLNVLNSQGHLYTADNGVKTLFDKSGSLRRRIEKGVLRAEVEHPRILPGMSTEDYLNRLMNIDMNNVCAQFSEVWLDENVIKQKDGRPVIAIMAKVIPSGVKANVLERALSNPKENVCFSVRGLTNDYLNRGQRVRELKQIITFDYVNEPGISIAEKYTNPTLESLDEVIVSKNEFIHAMNKNKMNCVATESSIELGNQIIEAFGWELPKGIKVGFTDW